MVLDNLVTSIGPAKVGDFIASPKGSRQFQQFIKLGTKEHRNAAVAALAKSVPDLAVRNIYALLTLEKIVTYGLKTDESFVTEKWLKPVMTDRKIVEQLFFNRMGCKFLNKLYLHPQVKPALKKQMLTIMQVPRSIEVLGESREKLRVHYLEIIKKCVDKELLGLEVIHKVFRQALADFPIDQDRAFNDDLLGMSADGLAHLLSTRDGVIVVFTLLGIASAKQKKNLIKELKGKFFEMAMNPVTVVVLLRLLQVTDDTVLVGKSIFGELLGDSNQKGKELMLHETGRTPFIYMLSGLELSNGKFYSSSDRDLFKGAASSVLTSLKSNEAKTVELCAKVVPFMVKIVLETMSEFVESNEGKDVVVALAKKGDSSEQQKVINSAMSYVASVVGVKDLSQSVVSCANGLLKDLPSLAGPAFMKCLLSQHGEESLKKIVTAMCGTKASFILLQLSKTEPVSAYIKSLLFYCKKEISQISQGEPKGTDLVKELADKESKAMVSIKDVYAQYPAVEEFKLPESKKQKTIQNQSANELFADDDEEEDDGTWGIAEDYDE